MKSHLCRSAQIAILMRSSIQIDFVNDRLNFFQDIDPEILRSMKVVGTVGYARNVTNTKRNQVRSTFGPPPPFLFIVAKFSRPVRTASHCFYYITDAAVLTYDAILSRLQRNYRK